MTPQALCRLERRKAERRTAKLLAEIAKTHPELRSPKRARPNRTEEFKAHRREVQREYRRRLQPLDVRA